MTTISAHQHIGEVMDESTALGLYRNMVRIRAFEDRVHTLKANDELEGFIHLTTGQEAVDAGVCALLQQQDAVFTSFRNHGQAIAKGLDINAMMAEMFGRATGCNRGRGGSMHISDHSLSFFGGNGIVGSSPPLALGPALTAKLRRTAHVSVCFFGDGAMQQGVVHESMNLAATWKLPVVFVCANNTYAQSTRLAYNSAVQDLASRAGAYAFPGVTVDGQDVVKVFKAAAEAVDRARAGDGPSLLEAVTDLFMGAWEGEHPDSKTYRDPDRDELFRSRDPIGLLGNQLVAASWATAEDLATVSDAAAKEVDDAVAFARASPWPTLDDNQMEVYAAPPPAGRPQQGVKS